MMEDTSKYDGYQYPVTDSTAMAQFSTVLLDVWREVGRHLDIASSAPTIARMLMRHLTLNLLMVRRFQLAQGSLDTVAWGSPDASVEPTELRTTISPTRLKRILAWSSSKSILRSKATKTTGDLALLAGNLEGDVIVGPLVGDAGPLGVLVLHSHQRNAFTDLHAEMLLTLLEPLTTALENDLRLHELASLREAAEADKRSLLTRLGRRDTGETIVGSDSGLRPVMERVELVSQSDVPVMILGETGTGKEVVSRAIHTRSARHAAPFIRVNCGAIPAELIDSQLFGHERGSFTGAADTRKGWFERADGGTLFLDEIGELPLQAQVRLLRVLQDGFIERVGGQQPIRVDVRIIAATHRDLPLMVKDGTFREDLWYRIAVFPILLPPLRERRDDIPSLARHFAERAANRFGLNLVMPQGEELRILMQYDWPGNIRELGAVIDRAAILGDGKTLEVATALGTNAPLSKVNTTNDIAQTSVKQTPETFATLDQAMRYHIEQALQATRGKIEGRHGAAALLKINPHTLRARMRKLGISWDDFRGPNFAE
jgi:hydrogenase-4 transcriptional activator